VTHAELQARVLELAKGMRLHVHLCDMHRSAAMGASPGFTDLVVIGRNGVLWRELKIPPDKLRPAQRALGYTLCASGQDWCVWVPGHLDSGLIEKELEAVK
jgi:hypothetical protein